MPSVLKASSKYLPAASLAFATLWLRLVNLGYSDYMPDEIKALYQPSGASSLIDFLLEQRKGPVQFLVTYLARFFTPNYDNTWLTRLPFALAGVAAVYIFYRLLARHFGCRLALYAALLLTLNGLILGLTRVVQYQPFVMLFSLGALYAFSLAGQEASWRVRGIYAGMLLWAAALLTHYDGIFILPLALYLLWRWYRDQPGLVQGQKFRHLGLAGLLSGLLLASFYLPWVVSISTATLDYWQYRISGQTETLLPSSSVSIFRLYNPLLVLELYLGLALLGLRKIRQSWPVVLWFLLGWLVLEGLVQEPGTHIYAYVIPATVLAGFGVLVVEEIYERRFKRFVPGKFLRQALFPLALGVMFAGLFALSHVVFIDHPPEYPLETKKFLIAKIGGINQFNIDYKIWAYGFPYKRHWPEIRDFILTDEPNGYYCTNEDKSLSSFYIPLVNDVERSGHYIHIYHPTDLKEAIAKPKINYWRARHPPVKVFTNRGVVVAEIYSMPPGDVYELIRSGY